MSEIVDPKMGIEDTKQKLQHLAKHLDGYLLSAFLGCETNLSAENTSTGTRVSIYAKVVKKCLSIKTREQVREGNKMLSCFCSEIAADLDKCVALLRYFQVCRHSRGIGELGWSRGMYIGKLIVP